ncbi:MAG: sensor histidine kinase [Lachnospiraceae bacterium]|nr:sensor histidine kinase [Lachnospiraceae bacterium]
MSGKTAGRFAAIPGRIFRLIRKKAESLSFSRKLIFIYLIVVLVSVIGSSVLFYVFSAGVMQERTYDYLKNLASVTMSKAELSVENVENTAFYISGNEDMQSLLYRSFDEDDRISRYQQYDEVRNLLSYYVFLSQEISSIYIKATDGQSYSYTKFNRVSPDEELWEEGREWICTDGHIYFCRAMYRFEDQSLLGTMLIDVQPSVFYDIVKDISYDAGSIVYIIDQDGYIVSGHETEMTGQPLSDVLSGLADFGEGDQATDGTGTGESFETVLLDGNQYALYTGCEIANGWKLVLAIPESYFLADIQRLQIFMTVLLIVTCLLAIGLVVFVGKGITRPITSLSEAMKKFGQGDFEVSCEAEGEDEIAVLTKSFNQMVSDIRTLIDEAYEQEMMQQEIEIKSLQMQINPHFLYNTLDTINWIARLNGVDQIGDLTYSLGNLMRYSLSKRDFVTIGEELKNLKDYVEIQNVRYGDRMTISYEADPELLDTYVPKLLLQPILENAIIHGVEDKLEPAQIQIRVYHEEEILYMIVEDDGVGMSQEAIERLLDMHPANSVRDTVRCGGGDSVQTEQAQDQKQDRFPLDNQADASRPHTSIGVNNVNRRIQKVYGASCGLQIQSQLGSGTKVTLRMRIMRQPPDIRLDYYSR